MLNEYDAKFIKVLDDICELKDRIYSECEDLDGANSIFEKLSTAKDSYICRVESRKRTTLKNHKKKFLKSDQNNLSGKDTHKFTGDKSPKDNVSNPHKNVKRKEKRKGLKENTKWKQNTKSYSRDENFREDDRKPKVGEAFILHEESIPTVEIKRKNIGVTTIEEERLPLETEKKRTHLNC